MERDTMRKTEKKGTRKSAAMQALDKMIGEPLTFGSMINTIRETDDYTLKTFAKKLSVSIGHVCDVEKGRRGVSPERAAKWAKALGYPEALFVKLAVQSELDAAGLKYSVEIKARRGTSAVSGVLVITVF